MIGKYIHKRIDALEDEIVFLKAAVRRLKAAEDEIVVFRAVVKRLEAAVKAKKKAPAKKKVGKLTDAPG